MNDLERMDRLIRLLNESLDLLAKYSQFDWTEPGKPEVQSFNRLIDARDEARTLRARFVSGATGGIDSLE